MTRGGGSHRTSSSTSGFSGPGARSQAKGPVLREAPPGLVFSRSGCDLKKHMLRDSHAVAHTHASRLGRACALPGGRGFKAGRCGWLVGYLMVRCSLLTLLGRLHDGRVTTFCFVRGYGRRRASRIMAWPTGWRPLRFRPVHAWLV